MAHPQPVIDLNSDLGEFGASGRSDDEALLSLVTSVGVACGFPGGDPNTMQRICWQAAEEGVAIGAHVGHRDLYGSDRGHIRVDPEGLINDIIYQVAALDGFARLAGTQVTYVKPHGVLYESVAVDPRLGAAVAEAVHRYDPDLPLLGLAGSEGLMQARTRGIIGVDEAFVDRAYDAEGRLVPRGSPGAVVHDVATVVERCTAMALFGKVTAIDGSIISFRPRSLRIRADAPGAVEMAREVRSALLDVGVGLSPFSTESLPPPRKHRSTLL